MCGGDSAAGFSTDGGYDGGFISFLLDQQSAFNAGGIRGVVKREGGSPG
jgi:hypothetical protein